MKVHFPPKKITKTVLITFIILLTLFILVWIIMRSVAPTIVAFAEARIRSLVTAAVNDAIFNVMSDGVAYGELITIEKGLDGDAVLLSANSVMINKLANDTAKMSEQFISSIGEQGIDIPLGTLTGTPLFSGKGPKVKILVEPVGSVICRFVSEFEQAGINQTRHKIYLDVMTEVDIIIPTAESTVNTITQVLVAESILIGNVPDTYLFFGTGNGNLLDLIP